MQTSLAFIAALALSLITTPLVRRFALKVGAVARPNARSVHKVPIPHLGGVAIYLSSVAAMLISHPIDPTAEIAVIVGGFVILVVGVLDDIYDLKPWQKGIGQIVSAGVVIAIGVSISFLTNPFSGALKVLGFLAIPLTIVWVISFENLVNFSDGLDGLAGGIVVITGTVIVFASYKAGAFGVPPAAAAIVGSVLGFLPYNFHPASIFMGDAGAMYLGLALSVLSVQGLVKSAVFMSVLAPLLALMVPISDTAFSIVRRTLQGQAFFYADHDHFHHRLLELGLGQRKTVLSIYLVSALGGALGLISGFSPIETGGPIVLVAVLALFIAASRAGLLTVPRKQGKGHADQSSGGQR
ncbi:MAG: glycosyltransferase family 4 protein [Bacillota bacterium]